VGELHVFELVLEQLLVDVFELHVHAGDLGLLPLALLGVREVVLLGLRELLQDVELVRHVLLLLRVLDVRLRLLFLILLHLFL